MFQRRTATVRGADLKDGDKVVVKEIVYRVHVDQFGMARDKVLKARFRPSRYVDPTYGYQRIKRGK